MNKKITEAIDFIKSIGLEDAVLAIPFSIGVKDILALRDLPLCKGLVLLNPSPEITATSTCEWLGCFENHSWRLPTIQAQIVFVGTHLMLTRQMATQVVKTRRFSIVCKVNGAYQRLPLHRFYMWRTGEKLLRSINLRSQNHLLRRSAEFVKKAPLLRSFWRQAFTPNDWSYPSSLAGSGRRYAFGLDEEAPYRELLRRARECAESAGFQYVPRRVLLVNAGLAAGGAERQIVNTLIGLRGSQQCESVSLLAEYIDHAPHLDFFRHELETAGIAVNQVRHLVFLSDDGLSSIAPQVAELIVDISPGLIEEILNLVEEFRARRPEIVHAWQDSTSIKVGIAAVIAGVPRIVLASRNVTPMNFTYHQEYMRPAYRALAELENIKFINNSEAGALDYIQWLKLARERFSVVRNGVDLTGLQRADVEEVCRYRRTLGIPQSVQVVGSVFRFWAEKRPMLWLETAREIAKQLPDVHFLLIGEGPMRSEMKDFIREAGLEKKVHMPGARTDIATPLSSMTVFMLTSEFEGTPNVVLEAQWLGLPVVATDAGGTREALLEGETGWCCREPEAVEISKKVRAILSDGLRLKTLRQVGPRFIDQQFGISEMIDQTLRLYGLQASPLLATQLSSFPELEAEQ